jgi:hypothetical protein
MGEEKTNSDYEKRQNKEPTRQDNTKQYVKKVIEDILGQNVNTDGEVPNEQQSSNTTSNSDLKLLTDKVANINILKFELDRLPLDFKARAYFENDVRPLADTLTVLSLAAYNFSLTVTNMSSTNFGHSSEIKDALDLVEELNEISEELIDVLKCKVHNMLKFSKYDI